ncbi:MAG: hypothetical protein K0R02_523 [Rickettsiaceae bacterium]|jgi:hypothetical protein|nr:hypothetical protein [Rickettsiaceae bacterium]
MKKKLYDRYKKEEAAKKLKTLDNAADVQAAAAKTGIYEYGTCTNSSLPENTMTSSIIYNNLPDLPIKKIEVIDNSDLMLLEEIYEYPLKKRSYTKFEEDDFDAMGNIAYTDDIV